LAALGQVPDKAPLYFVARPDATRAENALVEVDLDQWVGIAIDNKSRRKCFRWSYAIVANPARKLAFSQLPGIERPVKVIQQ
jgi:non-canonical (house-cleaning) NTP pyrophosphatase